MNEFGKSPLRPTPRGLVELVREGAYRNRDSNTLGGKKHKLVFPIQTSRRNGRARQPVERDVVEDVISRQALSLPVKDACDEFVTSNVVVYHPRCEADRRILERIQRLRPVVHLLRVAEAIFEKEVKLLIRMPFVGGEPRRRRATP